MFKRLADISSTPYDKREFGTDDSLPLPTCKVGIEIEMEGVKNTTLQSIAESGYWKIVPENSLRGECAELVSVPVFGTDISKALDVIEEGFKRKKKPTFNGRTSLHVHVEVVDLELEELIRFILLYCAFELVLFRLCDETRQKMIYCLPTYISECTKRDTAKLIEALEEKKARTTQSLIARWPKYNAMNLNNITGIGTIEFRQLHGTINKAEILDWIKVLMSIKKYAKESKDKYNQFPEIVSGFAPHKYLETIFGELADKLYSPNLAEDLLTGVRCAQDILLYRRLSTSTQNIYDKQLHKEPCSFTRITGKNIPHYHSRSGGGMPKKIKLGGDAYDYEALSETVNSFYADIPTTPLGG